MDFFRLYGNLLRFDGTNQGQRKLPALEQGYILPDERSLSDLVNYAQHLAREIRFYDLSGQAVGDWSPFFDQLVVVDPKTGSASPHPDLETAIDARSDWPPHLALFLVFLKLFKNLQDDLNELPQRHLSHYYEKELRLPRKPAVPDKVHVFFELARNARNTLLPAGTALDAGKDARGRPLRYLTENELVVSAATVAEIRRLVMETDVSRRRFFISNALSDTEKTSWYTFGRKQINLDASQRFMAEAELGFAIASPLLRMAEGKRLLKITAYLQSSRGKFPPDLHISYALHAVLTGAKGWLAPERFTAELVREDVAAGQLNMTLTLGEGAAAIIPCDPKLHSQCPPARWPVLRLLLRGDCGLHQTLDGLTVVKLKLELGVSGMRKLVLQNDEGLLKPGQPMPLFGSRPAIGSPFYIGSAEVFGKPLTSLNLKLAWHAPPENLFDHYKAYFESESWGSIQSGFAGKFTVGLCLLHDGSWIQPLSQSKRPLFGNKASTQKTIELDIPDCAQVFGRLPYPPQASLAGLSRYDFDTRYGFMRLELSGPTRTDFPASTRKPPFEAFGHQVFPRRYADQVIAQGQLAQANIQRDWSQAIQASTPNSVSITGIPIQGQKLAASNTLADAPGGAVTYQWLRDGKAIATDSVYTLGQDDLGKIISVTASYNTAGTVISVPSAPMGPIADASEPPVLPNEPYTPALESVSLDYTAVVEIVPGDRRAEEEFFTLGPFGYTTAGGEAPARLVPQILDDEPVSRSGASTPDPDAAALYLGIAKLEPPANLSLLFQIDEGTAGSEALKPDAVKWSYLSGGVWKDLTPDGVLKDSTLGFQKPGLVVLALGRDATTEHTAMPAGMVWLRSLIRRPPESAARTLLLHAQAALASFDPETGTSSGSALFEASNLKDLPSFVARLQDDSNSSTRPISSFVWGQFEPAAQQVLSDPNTLLAQRQSTLLRILNKIVQGKSIHDPTRFAAVVLRPETQSLLKKNPTGNDLIRLNRFLLEDVYPQEIARNSLTGYDEHLRNGLAAGAIKGLKIHNASIRKVSQPYASFDGRASEQDAAFFPRVSERLRHRNRAVTAWDLERLVLDRFPEVFKVKCLPHSDAEGKSKTGETTLVIVPDRRDAEVKILEPRAGAVLKGQIEEYVGSGLASPFATIHVIHPVYERIRVFARVKFASGRDPGYYSAQLNEDLRMFLSPWAYRQGEDIQFDARIYKSDILAFIEGRDYVDYVTGFRLYHSYQGPSPYGGTSSSNTVVIDGQSGMVIGDDFVVGMDVEAAIATQPHAILVSHPQHLIMPIAVGKETCAGVSRLGIGYMTVAMDFLVEPEAT